MSTLYQLHGNLAAIKQQVKALEMLWQPFDSIVLLGETVAYLDWIEAYIADSTINEVRKVYVLQADLDALDSHTQHLLDMSEKRCQIITDDDWVKLTLPIKESDNVTDDWQVFDKVVTLA